MTAREKNLVRRAEKFAMVDDVRRNSTRQGQWEASFLSLDCPDADEHQDRHAERRQIDRDVAEFHFLISKPISRRQ